MTSPVDARRACVRAPESQVVQDLMRTHGRIATRSARILRAHGVTEQQYQLLRILYGADASGPPCLELARQLMSPPPNLSRLLDRLVRLGWVQRLRDAPDRRVVTVQLTDRGWRRMERLAPLVAEFYRERFAHLTDPELLELARLLRKAGGES